MGKKELRAGLIGRDIKISDSIGAPISASVAWSMAADCFVSIWGASLAKYRWVCNTPGFVISSRYNLLHRIDLHIYDAPQYMEAPTPLLFADPEAIIDDPDAPQLINVAPGQASFFNFRVDESVVFPSVIELLEQSWTISMI